MRFFLYLIFVIFISPVSAQDLTVYVSPKGNDENAGTQLKPLKTIQRALSLSRSGVNKKVSIQLMAGTYYLDETLKIKTENDSIEELEIKAYENQKAIISAGRLLQPNWSHFKNGIFRASVPKDMSFERLYINGVLQTMARYPNRDTTKNVFDGTAEDATYYMRVLTWGNPFGGYVHALDENLKGSLHYKITGVDDTDNLELEGDGHNKNPLHMHHVYRFVENILGELDVPGEWYLDKSIHALYYYPQTGTDISKAVVEVSNLKNSIQIIGTDANPAQNITLKNLHFRHNERTFLDSESALPGSDWPVFRGGTIVLENTENCKIADCTFIDLGGNAVVFNRSNHGDSVTGCLFSKIGASAISFFSDNSAKPLNEKLTVNNTQDNLIQYAGEIEKQAAAIHLNSVSGVAIKNNTIYHTPGAGIKIENTKNENIQFDLNDIFHEYLELQADTVNTKVNRNNSGSGSKSGVQKEELKKLAIKFK